jgi:hypothetical protein
LPTRMSRSCSPPAAKIRLSSLSTWRCRWLCLPCAGCRPGPMSCSAPPRAVPAGRTARAPAGHERLVVGGHADTIPQFLALLPPDLRDRFIGSFVADTSTITPARVRALAVPIIRNWVERSEQQLVTRIRQEPPGGLAATGLAACLTATRQHAVHILAMPCQGLVPGFACRSCGTVGSHSWIVDAVRRSMARVRTLVKPA